ncbi:hypothetical protein MN608_08550 [Microdochium nivale]|nr:hypothetical protein MN608_08550 [Microdochium nivale]
MTTRNRKTGLSFLDLPPEIRVQIYSIVLWRKLDTERRLMPSLPSTPSTAISPERVRATIRPRWRHTTITTQPGLLARTCRQLYEEFAPMVYSSHAIIVALHDCHEMPHSQPRLGDAQAMTAALEFLEITTMSASPRLSCQPPFVLCTSLTLYIYTPVSPAIHRRWLDALGWLARNSGALKELRIGFGHDRYFQQCTLGKSSVDSWLRQRGMAVPERTGLGQASESGVGMQADDLRHPTPGCCVELTKDAAIVEIIARIQGLDRLEITGFYHLFWPALLDELVDSRLALFDIQTMRDLSGAARRLPTPMLLRVDYRTAQGADPTQSQCKVTLPIAAERDAAGQGPVEAYVYSTGRYRMRTPN